MINARIIGLSLFAVTLCILISTCVQTFDDEKVIEYCNQLDASVNDRNSCQPIVDAGTDQ